MKNAMPQAKNFERPKALQWEIPPLALERWTPALAEAKPSDNSISVFDPIGMDPWTGEGVTAKRIAAALRSIGEKNDVVVNLNSPGGDLFEGMAIYNLLREHKGQVQVKVLGLAASAASIVAMAGDEILIARSGFFMVHNTWVMAMGNRNDLRAIADTLEPFDEAMADIYAARTQVDRKSITKLMDAETWINGSTAVDDGWADGFLAADAVTEGGEKAERVAGRVLDLALAKLGMPRSSRRSLMHEFKSGTRDAAGAGMHDAAGTGALDAAEVRKVLAAFSI